MDLFFGFVGFVGFLLFLVLIVLALFKKNGKVKRYSVLLGISFVIFIIGLSMPGSEVPVEEETASATVEKEKPEEKKEEPKKDVKSEEEKKADEEAKKKAEEEKKKEEEAKAAEEAKKKAEEERKQAETKKLNTYAQNILEALEPLRNDMLTFADLNMEASENPTLMYDQDWIMEMALTLNSMETGISKVKKIDNVPDSLKESHNLTVKAMDEYQYLVENYPDAIDNLDVDLMMKCVEAMQRGHGHLEESNTILDELLAGGLDSL
jgi:alpha-galactosidase/6-phospho-beta-glucosidase family protein